MSTDAIRAADGDSPTTELVTGVVGDRCPNCQAPLAGDQRYCVNCGERRGRPRFSYDTLVAQTAPATSAPAAPPPRRSRFSPGTNLIAGVATLLIAIGVGVLIGHYSNTPAPRASAPSVITVGGAGTSSGANTSAANTSGANTAGANTGGASATAAHASKGKSAAKLKVTHVVVTAKTAKAATAAASHVLGSSHNLSNNAQQQVGSSCSGGQGCQNGSFTGNFFPGG